MKKYVKNFGSPFQGEEDFKPCYLAADVERVLQIYKDALKAIGYRKTCDCSKCVKGTKLLAQLKPEGGRDGDDEGAGSSKSKRFC